MKKETIVTNENADTVEVVAKFAAPHALSFTLEKMTIGNYLDIDNLYLPNYQRTDTAWTDKQYSAFVQTIMLGRPIPAIILGEITNDKGDTIKLLVDGNQRTTAIKRLVDGYASQDNLSDYDSAALDYILGHEVPIMTVTADTPKALAELFVAYNNGSPLSAIQRNKASLPDYVIGAVNPYIDYFAQKFGRRMGKVTSDTAAMMLAAAMTDPNAAATSSAVATKILVGAEADDVPPVPAAIIDAICAGINDANRQYLLSPARLIPFVLAAVEVDADPATITAAAANYDHLSAVKIPTVWTSGKGKNAKTERKAYRAGELLANTSNGVKATTFRRQTFVSFLAETPAENAAAVEAVEAVINKMAK